MNNNSKYLTGVQNLYVDNIYASTTIENSDASYYTGLTSNIQNQLNSLGIIGYSNLQTQINTISSSILTNYNTEIYDISNCKYLINIYYNTLSSSILTNYNTLVVG